ncbi:MAG: CDP-alcohol phosphatidyltransferase family protein [Bacteroidaceae bacterium]|nr:CDP-alcohol phosphatidyltransferase family protein [Bacteroidaceae bacterium]
MAENTSLQSTLKSQDTEETIDVYFTRPIGLLWARFFNLFDAHPNVITILSIFLGVAAGICMGHGYGSWTYTLLGIGLLMWANFYDSADGQLARMTGKRSLWGRILDGFAGDAWFISIYAALGFRLMSQPVLPFWDESPLWSWWIFPVFYFVGFHMHGVQSRLADYYRNVHLYFIKGAAGSELDSAEKLRADYARIRWSEQPAWKLFLYFYCNHTAAQERETPAFQQLKQLLDERYGQNIPADVVEQFRAGSLPLMKWTNFLTFNWRAFSLYASLLLGVATPWAVILYPLLEATVFQFVYLRMRRQHEQHCRALRQSLLAP